MDRSRPRNVVRHVHAVQSTIQREIGGKDRICNWRPFRANQKVACGVIAHPILYIVWQSLASYPGPSWEGPGYEARQSPGGGGGGVQRFSIALRNSVVPEFRPHYVYSNPCISVLRRA